MMFKANRGSSVNECWPYSPVKFERCKKKVSRLFEDLTSSGICILAMCRHS